MSACCIPEPNGPAHAPPPKADAYVTYVLDALGTPAPAPPIVWLGHDAMDGKSGAYYTCSQTIYVEQRDSLYQSSLAHELAHYHLDVTGQPDEGHTHPLFSLGIIEDIDADAYRAIEAPR